MSERVFVCRWVSGGVTIKDKIRAKDPVEALEKAQNIAKKNNWILKAVVAAFIEFTSKKPEVS